ERAGPAGGRAFGGEAGAAVGQEPGRAVVGKGGSDGAKRRRGLAEASGAIGRLGALPEAEELAHARIERVARGRLLRQQLVDLDAFGHADRRDLVDPAEKKMRPRRLDGGAAR